jgi:hypothetical protein
MTMKNFLVTFSTLVLLAWSGLQAADTLDLGPRRELFVDRFLIAELKGAALKLHSPQLAPPVSPPRPDGHYATVLRIGDTFRFYYRGDKVPGAHWRNGWDTYHLGEVTLAAESKDGIHWTLPNYGIYQHPTFPQGNVVLADDFLVTHNFTPFIDARPGVPPAEKFKALGGGRYQPQHAKFREKYGAGGLKAYASADGIHWRRLQEAAVSPEAWGSFDSQNHAFWSESERRYVCYFRIFDGGRRSIARTTSQDFLRWSEPVAMKPNAPGEELYTGGTQPYMRAPHIYIALPTRFIAKRGAATDIAFMTTRGGNTYDRTFMESIIRPGLGKDGWANRANYAALGIHQTGPHEMSVLLTGGRRYTLRLDGFASVNAPFAGGEMVTKPLRFSGRELEINFSTSAGGQIRVEVQDEAGQPRPGFALADCVPIYGDEIARVVKWKPGADLGALAGQPVRLRFAMEDADLFSLRFRDER